MDVESGRVRSGLARKESRCQLRGGIGVKAVVDREMVVHLEYYGNAIASEEDELYVNRNRSDKP